MDELEEALAALEAMPAAIQSAQDRLVGILRDKDRQVSELRQENARLREQYRLVTVQPQRVVWWRWNMANRRQRVELARMRNDLREAEDRLARAEARLARARARDPRNDEDIEDALTDRNEARTRINRLRDQINILRAEAGIDDDPPADRNVIIT